MKLKSCFLIMLMVCAFFSCSDNAEQPIDLTIKPIVPEASLSLAVQADGAVKTKGGFISNATTWDSQVKTVTAVVFNNGAYNEANVKVGSVAAVFTQSYNNTTPQTNQQIEGSDLPAGGVNILLIANLEQTLINQLLANAAATTADVRWTFEQVQGLTTSLKEEMEGKGLTMCSSLIPVELVPGINYIGFEKSTSVPVPYTPEGGNAGTEIWGQGEVNLVRTVASINLVSIDLPETPDSENPDVKSVSFKLKEVFVANVKSTACLNGGEKEPKDATGNYDSKFYLAPAKYVSETGTLKFGEASAYKALSAKLFFGEKGDSILAGGEYWDNTSMQKMISPCFVYPNGKGETDQDANKNYTVLVLKGDYTNTLGLNKDRYYAIVVNDSRYGELNGSDGKTNEHIQRNTRYKINVSIQGTGSTQPFTPDAFAHVAAQIEVANWQVINIDQPVD